MNNEFKAKYNKMILQKDLLLSSKSGRSFLLDYYLPNEAANCPVVIFAHGFKGFKDWGCWQLMAEKFVNAGYAFVKFNFSYNGTTPDQPMDFADLEAFGQNNYTRELQDLNAVVNWIGISSNWPRPNSIDNNKIALIGHSRGGGISIIKAASDERIKALITWAAVARLDYSWHKKEEQIKEWEKAGVLQALNGRTKQMMPLYYQLFEDFFANEEAFNTELALQKRSDLPILFIHGTADPAVPFSAAEQLKEWRPNAELVLLNGANHVFGGKHPWPEDQNISEDGVILCNCSISFLKRHL
ncbi:MAG: pimeloyl-ACP methyl ester carboxylesterase [Polaribacter sp.]